MIRRKLEIVVMFVALAFFVLCEYQRADFLILFLIYTRLINEVK